MRKQIESISRYIFPFYDEKTSIWRYGFEHQSVAAPFSLLSPSQLPHSGCGQWPWALACTGYICSKRGTKRRGRSSTVPKHFGVSASSQDRHPVRRRRPLSVCLLFSPMAILSRPALLGTVVFQKHRLQHCCRLEWNSGLVRGGSARHSIEQLVGTRGVPCL